MKNLLKLGKTLNKAEQKQIIGGIGPQSPFLSSGCINNCETRCPDATVGSGSRRWECVDTCASPNYKECRIYSN